MAAPVDRSGLDDAVEVEDAGPGEEGEGRPEQQQPWCEAGAGRRRPDAHVEHIACNIVQRWYRHACAVGPGPKGRQRDPILL